MCKEILLWYDDPLTSDHTLGVLSADTRTGGCSKSKPPVYPESKIITGPTGHDTLFSKETQLQSSIKEISHNRQRFATHYSPSREIEVIVRILEEVLLVTIRYRVPRVLATVWVTIIELKAPRERVNFSTDQIKLKRKAIGKQQFISFTMRNSTLSRDSTHDSFSQNISTTFHHTLHIPEIMPNKLLNTSCSFGDPTPKPQH